MEIVRLKVVHPGKVVVFMDCKKKKKRYYRLFLFVFVYNSCGTTAEHCGNIDTTQGQGNCQQTGCAPGLCCSRFG
jgi:hypothetical protein